MKSKEGRKYSMDNGYIVSFMRSDDLPDEEYSHHSSADALAQYTSQQPETNDVYFAVQLIEVSGNTRTVKATVLPALTDEERAIVSKIGCNDQFATCLRLKEILPLLSDDGIRESAITARIKIENLSPAKFPIFFDLLRRQAAI